ncbi:MAG: hypothetical protein EOO20_16890 [Chryseobacterium sp.]|nr:MAG: hypothetical protein EOO20_16890 [Chryseobacterium sp.]
MRIALASPPIPQSLSSGLIVLEELVKSASESKAEIVCFPESVRWAAKNGASIVFHPHFNGNNEEGSEISEWGAASSPYYEKAMMMRSIENDYGKTGVLITDIDTVLATGLLAARFKNELY